MIIKMIMNMNTNNTTLADFGSTIAIITNKMATTWMPNEIKTFSYEFLKIRLCDYAKKFSLVEDKYFDKYCELVLDLDDLKMDSFRTAMVEYSKVMH